eukprot:1266801-Pyramimonas_sp.AAC.1
MDLSSSARVLAQRSKHSSSTHATSMIGVAGAESIGPLGGAKSGQDWWARSTTPARRRASRSKSSPIE